MTPSQTCGIGHVVLIIVLLLSHTQDGCCYNTCDELIYWQHNKSSSMSGQRSQCIQRMPKAGDEF